MIHTDESEYEFIKSELIKSPISVPSEFLHLYDELKEEKDKISQEDSKELDNELNQ